LEKTDSISLEINDGKVPLVLLPEWPLPLSAFLPSTEQPILALASSLHHQSTVNVVNHQGVKAETEDVATHSSHYYSQFDQDFSGSTEDSRDYEPSAIFVSEKSISIYS